MLNSLWGVFLFHLLPNDWCWSLLSEEERELVKKNNHRHNNERADYSTPASYGEGEKNFDAQEPVRARYPEFLVLEELLAISRPEVVLEIGPGSGFFTRPLFETDSLKTYCAVDINPNFLDYIKERIDSSRGDGVACRYLAGDFVTLDDELPPADLILLAHAVHHIPDREELFRQLKKRLKPGGRIVCIDPTHYIPRLRVLTEKFFFFGHASFKFHRKETDGEKFITHHFCTRREYKKICRSVGGLSVEKEAYFHYEMMFESLFRKLSHVLPKLWRLESALRRWSRFRWMSGIMVAVIRRDP